MILRPTQPLSGFIELTPVQQRVFDLISTRISNVFKNSGFMRLDLPAIERAEVLIGDQDSDELKTQIYLFEKGDTKMGLRYDGTVGLARYVSGHVNDLFFPFRAFQLNRVYRGERPQRGRYREFYQMDIDIIGEQTLSTNYDAEIIATLANAYGSISEFVGPTIIKIGSREFWNAFFEYGEFDENESRAAFSLIDKKDKLNFDDFRNALIDSIGKDKTEMVLSVFENKYDIWADKSERLTATIDDIKTFEKQLESFGIKNYTIDLSIMRGHAYYTGIVFEFYLTDHPELNSVGGGGRYADLCSRFSKNQYVGVGAAIGLSRMIVALFDQNKIDLSRFESVADAAVLVMGNDRVAYALNVLAELRGHGVSAIPYLDADKKFKKQMEFANKINVKYTVIIGEDEEANKTATVKNMESGDQETMSISDVIKKLSDGVR